MFEGTSTKIDESTKPTPVQDFRAALFLSSEQHDKLQLVTKILIYYRSLIREIIIRNLNINSPEWQQVPKFYFVKEAQETKPNVIVKIFNYEIKYGFQFYSPVIDEDFSLIYQSTDIQHLFANLSGIILAQSSPLLHGKKVKYT